MPFIEQKRRDIIDKQGLERLSVIEPGDRCYVYYKEMVDQWQINHRWTMAHNIFKDATSKLIVDEDDDIARALAWQVFFQLHVMPYELEKRRLNGDI